MKASINLFRVTNALADCLLAGLSINIRNKAYSKRITVTDTDTGERATMDVWPDDIYLYFHRMPSDLIMRNPIHLSPQDKDPPPW